MLLALALSGFIQVETSWKRPLLIYGSVLGADIATTEWAEARGALEKNAAYRGGGKYALHAASAALLTTADVWAQKRRKRWLVWTLRVGAAAAYGRAAYRNEKNRRILSRSSNEAP